MPATARPLLSCLLSGLLLLGHAPAQAEARSYTVDPSHSYPSFEADHMGLSLWRGKFNSNRGSIVLDKAAGEGRVEIVTDIASLDFGHEAMNAKARGPELFDTARFPQAVFLGRLEGFQDGKPSRLTGELSLHGQTRPLTLQIHHFACKPHPMLAREICGADAEGVLDRSDFGIDAGRAYGFDMAVRLRIQVEAVADQ